jgi:anti-sigma B factor antagonist
MNALEISQTREDGALILGLAGRLDTTGGPALEQYCQEHLAAGDRRVVFDFSQTGYVSSAGLRAILKLTKIIEAADGRLVLCGLQEMVAQVFCHAGFDTFLKIEKNRDDALRVVDC